MGERESTTSRPVGMCEKLFNVFNPASRSRRRLTEPEATTNPSPTPVKPRPPTTDQKKPYEVIAPKAEPKPTTPPPKPTSVPVLKVPDKVVLTSAPPKVATTPQPAPPKAAPPQGAAAAERPKKNINEKVEDYIKRARDRIRTVSGVGRTPTS